MTKPVKAGASDNFDRRPMNVRGGCFKLLPGVAVIGKQLRAQTHSQPEGDSRCEGYG
jgi:hypothetical protein